MLLPLETYPGYLSVDEESYDLISVHLGGAERFMLALGTDPAGMGETIFNGRASPPWVAHPANPTDLCHGEEKLCYLMCTHTAWPQLVC